jgi:hypothetical protein
VSTAASLVEARACRVQLWCRRLALRRRSQSLSRLLITNGCASGPARRLARRSVDGAADETRVAVRPAEAGEDRAIMGNDQAFGVHDLEVTIHFPGRSREARRTAPRRRRSDVSWDPTSRLPTEGPELRRPRRPLAAREWRPVPSAVARQRRRRDGEGPPTRQTTCAAPHPLADNIKTNTNAPMTLCFRIVHLLPTLTGQ